MFAFRKTVILGACLALVLLTVQVAVATHEGPGEPDPGAAWFLFGTAQEDVDPENRRNDVVTWDTDVTDTSFGSGVRRFVAFGTKVPWLDNQLEVKYHYVGRTCAAGSTRFQLGVDTDGDGKANGNAFGYVGDQAFGGGCPSGSWVYEDMTNDAPKWDLSQFGGGMTNTWDQVETFFAAFPDHQVRRIWIIDDAQSFSEDVKGCAYIDLTSGGARTITDWDDTRYHQRMSDEPNNC